MKESFNSLRVLFLAIGLLGLLGAVGSVGAFAELTFVGKASLLIAAGFSVLYLYFAIKLKELLPAKKQIIQTVIVIGGIYNVVNGIISQMQAGYGEVPTFVGMIASSLGTLIALGILVYLYVSVGKVSNRIEQGANMGEITKINKGNLLKTLIYFLILIVFITFVAYQWIQFGQAAV